MHIKRKLPSPYTWLLNFVFIIAMCGAVPLTIGMVSANTTIIIGALSFYLKLACFIAVVASFWLLGKAMMHLATFTGSMQDDINPLVQMSYGEMKSPAHFYTALVLAIASVVCTSITTANMPFPHIEQKWFFFAFMLVVFSRVILLYRRMLVRYYSGKPMLPCISLNGNTETVAQKRARLQAELAALNTNEPGPK